MMSRSRGLPAVGGEAALLIQSRAAEPAQRARMEDWQHPLVEDGFSEMPQYRSRTPPPVATWPAPAPLWRATGMKDGDFEKPIIAVVNSFTQFVPGHVHLKDLGQLVARDRSRRRHRQEFNTIAIDDGIAMGHGGMLYSLPSRDLIADSVEYMANAHTADALVCISNCDKITLAC